MFYILLLRQSMHNVLNSQHRGTVFQTVDAT